LRGLSQKEIAGRLAIGVRTVQRWQKRDACPASQPRRKRRSIFDPYASYVLSRWEQGSRDISQIYQEIQDHGFKGSIRVLYRFVRITSSTVSPASCALSLGSGFCPKSHLAHCSAL
jgi:transposase